jgi:hypothetical protein
VETLGVGIMNSTAFSPSSKSNSKIGGNQIAFEAEHFQEQPPTLAPIFASLDQEIDLRIISFNFRIGSLGSVRLSGLVNSGPSARKTAIAAISETSVGSSSEVNLPVNIKTTKGSTVEELNEIMKNLDLDESSGSKDIGSDENLEKSQSDEGTTPRVLIIGIPAVVQEQDGQSKPKKPKTN